MTQITAKALFQQVFDLFTIIASDFVTFNSEVDDVDEVFVVDLLWGTFPDSNSSIFQLQRAVHFLPKNQVLSLS